MVRAGGSIEVFLDGVSQYTASDPSNYTNPIASILHFFIDDGVFGGETFVGSVDFIRIHNDASTFGMVPGDSVNTPEPATFLLVALGGVALVFAVRRRRSARA